MGGAGFVAWERGDVLGLAAHRSPSPLFQLKVLNFGNVSLRKKGCETVPGGSKERRRGAAGVGGCLVGVV